MKSGGINIRLGTYPGGLWHDSKTTPGIKRGYGINFAIVWGPMWWAIPKFWKKASDKYAAGNIWRVVTLPLIIGPLLTVSLGRFGFYIGFKQNGWGANTSIIPTARLTRNRDI